MNMAMKLQSEPFEAVKSGAKDIELRLNDEKRRQLNVGDTITFSKLPDKKETVSAEVVGLLHYLSFAALAEDFAPQRLGGTDKTSIIEGMRQYYSEEEQAETGVVGIKLRVLGGESYTGLRRVVNMAVPYCGAIVEREVNGKKQVLLQTRWKPERDPVYSGTLEFPAGVLDHPYESVYDEVAREVQEETGLTLKRIRGDDRTKEYTTGRDDASIGFRPYCCTQQLKNGLPWIGFVFVCEVEDGEPVAQVEEVRDVRWADINEVRDIFEKTPEKFFSLELPAWQYYLAEN